MQKWEYRTATLLAIPSISGIVKGWRLRAINDQELPNWKKAEMYSTIAVFCNQMGQEGWELINTVSTGLSQFSLLLFFKRPCE